MYGNERLGGWTSGGFYEGVEFCWIHEHTVAAVVVVIVQCSSG